jgi:hypothetical protein
VGGRGGHRVFEIISFPSHFVGEVRGRRVFDASCDSYMILRIDKLPIPDKPGKGGGEGAWF